MKIYLLLVVCCVVALLSLEAALSMENPEKVLAADEAVHQFLSHWTAYCSSHPPFSNRQSMHPFADVEAIFTVSRELPDGQKQIRRQLVRYGEVPEKNTPYPFGPILTIMDPDMLQDVKVADATRNEFSMVVPGAIALSEAGEVVQLKALAKIRLYEGRPWVIEFEATAPSRRWSIRQLKMIFFWDYYTTYIDHGERDQYWLPVKVLVIIRQRQTRGKYEKAYFRILTEHWQLEKIVTLKRTILEIDTDSTVSRVSK